MWQSGRINFFWGGFPAFMVYALPLTHPPRFALRAFCGIPTKTTEGESNRQLRPKKKIKYNI